MFHLRRHWALGIEAGDLVYVRGQGDRMAKVIEFIPELADELYAGQVPVLYLDQPEKHGVVWVPADDIVQISTAPN